MRIATAIPASLLCLLASCSSPPPGFLNTDVLEPAGMSTPNQQGVKLQGTIFQEGTLTYDGKGQVTAVYAAYIDSMRALDWRPASSEGDPSKALTGRLIKDTRTLHLSVTAGPEGKVHVVIRVAPSSK